MGEKEVIATTEIKREKGFIYPTGTDENGNLTIIKVKAGRNKKEVKTETTTEEVKNPEVVDEVKIE